MANQMTITFNVENQILSRTDSNRIVEKSKNYLVATFNFSSDWEGTRKAVIIEKDNLKFKKYLDENNSCVIPNRAIVYDGFEISVVGEDDEKFITITTNDLFISILSNNVNDDTPSYVEEIESETLDVTRDGEKYNIEIPSEYVTDEKLLQELENYVDNESLEETLQDYAKETDLSVYATKQELNEKSKVVANPTLSGDEATLEGAEIDGIKYKVGGGSEVHLYHHCVFVFLGGISFHINIYNSSPTAFVYNTLLSYIREECLCTDSASYISASGGYTTNNITYGVIGVGGGFNQIQCAYINENGVRVYTPMNSGANFVDTVTQIF